MLVLEDLAAETLQAHRHVARDRHKQGEPSRRTSGPATRHIPGPPFAQQRWAARWSIRIGRPYVAAHRLPLDISARRLAARTDIPVENGRFIVENYCAVAHLIDRPPHTVMHGDAHPGNSYFRNGEAGLLDWQAVRRATPPRTGLPLVTGMTTAERRRRT